MRSTRVRPSHAARASIASVTARPNGWTRVTSADHNLKPLTVPERHVAGFEAIRDMSVDDFSLVLGLLNAVEPTASRRVLDESLQNEIHVAVSETSALLDAITGLATHSHFSQSSVAAIAKRVASSPQLQLGDDAEDLASRIERLLTCDAIRVYSKASAVGTSHERIFATAQILTDLRPVFRDDETSYPQPEGALLTHTLSLHYISSDGTHDNFFVVLDDDDIETMRKSLDRAMNKAASMRQLILESGLLSLHPTEG